MLNSMHKSKNRYFYNIFVSPGDAPGVITLNVVWMESEFDAYKLCRCMYPSNYNNLRDIGNMRRVVLATATLIGGNDIGQYYR